MTTVPGPNTPPPADNSKTTLIGPSSDLYVRPTAGGNAGAGPALSSESGFPVNRPGNVPTAAAPNIGHGATQIVAQPDVTGHPSGDISGGGTVGNSGQGLGQ